MDDNQIRSRVEAAGWILDAAKADGLPVPRCIDIGNGLVEFQVEDREQLLRWATWQNLGVTEFPLDDDAAVGPGKSLIRADGSMYEVTLRVYTTDVVLRPVGV
jgi:hypothetical protein